MLVLRRLVRSGRIRTLVVPALVIGFVSLLAALIVTGMEREEVTAAERAAWVAQRGDLAGADLLYWDALLSASPEERLEIFIALIDNRSRLKRTGGARPLVADEAIPGFITSDRLAGDEATLARFWYEVTLGSGEADAAAVRELADRQPPQRWANHLLGRVALVERNSAVAARRFEREGLAFPAASNDLRLALALWSQLGEHDELRQRIGTPAYESIAGPRLRLSIAEKERDWLSFLLWLWPASFEGVGRWSLFLAAIAALLWFTIAARMGQIGDGPKGRQWLYVVAFVLGVISIYPTLVVITIQEELLGFRMTGEPLPDMIYFVFGVGLREELCKLLLFLPLLPLLLRRGSRVEALTCGALVGLGFAAEENIGYFERYDAATAIGRFLTANFLHMALTALIAVSAFDSLRGKARQMGNFGTVFPLAVLIHGAYDFLLTSVHIGELSILAMTLFIIVAQFYLREQLATFPEEKKEGLMQTFVLSLLLLTGLSFVYAAALVGIGQALPLMVMGVAGVAIITVMFIREMRPS
jgi:protease PrsW